MPDGPGQPVRITDVSPRDGLQNEAGIIPTAQKLALIDHLRKTGVDEIEVSSFVSAKWVPQLGDAAELFAALASADDPAAPPARSPIYSALVPNEKGLDQALAVNQRAGRPLIAKASVFTAASETFSSRNTNGTIAQTLERFKPVITRAHASGLVVRGYVSCVFACPFEGPTPPAKVLDVAAALIDLGVDELDYGDTIGAGLPESTAALLVAHRDRFGTRWLSPEAFTLHLHDTFGHASACVRTALTLGVRSFDSSVAGLGGCPYASLPGKPAPGNISTETLVNTIRQAGLATRVDSAILADAAAYARSIVAASRLSGASGA
jgi:hydroxymethylglutaryl-CoA lyase